MKRARLIGLLFVVAALLALPGSALAKGGHADATHSNNGNHCGQGHVKHSTKVGKSCLKADHHSVSNNGGAVDPENEADDENEGDDDDQGDDDQGDDLDD